MRFCKTKTLKAGCRKTFAIYMVLTLLFEIGFPSVSWALTGGPTQPEVQNFTPVGTTEMVDPFSGDFTYNIPLLDIDGYPINISYHSGVGMDQEASWVGLGWNINPGVINRGMRGMPDDFNGEMISKEFNVKPNRTFGLNYGYDLEFLGLDGNSLGGIGYGYSLHFNNYTGIGLDRSIKGHVPFAVGGGVGGSASLGITSSSDNGLTIQPSLSFSHKIAGDDDASTKLGISIGTSFNSRAGLSALTIGLSVSTSYSNKDPLGVSHGTNHGSSFSVASSSFNFGMPTYTPQLTLPFSNLSLSASFKLGGEEIGFYESEQIGGSFTQQKLMTHWSNMPAYGYLHAEEGVKYDNAVMDFNREKDQPFSPSSVALPLTNFTYDVLAVTGQGVGGSYRPFRSDFGHVFDPAISNPSFTGSIGGEVGFGDLFKIGLDVAVNTVTSQSGKWKNDDASNAAYNNLYFTQNSPNPSYEKFYYREANEKSVNSDTTFLSRAGGLQADKYNLNQVAQFDTRLDSLFENGNPGPSGTRQARDKRSQTISILTRSELAASAISPIPQLSSKAQPYHTAEITSTTPDGKRYVYGIAAYNNTQEEATFAVGTDEFGGHGGLLNSYNLNNDGLIPYYPGSDNSIHSSHGVDNYYSNTILPPYAHSYLLTAVLSEDYVDVDGIKGPSQNDLGTYTKFNYTKVDSTYKWRTPFQSGMATYNEGLKWTSMDDKGSYIYGEKELWYLTSVESKNYIAVFNFDNLRNDGYGVIDKNGGRDNAHPMRKLNKISLYTKVNYNANKTNSAVALIPIKEVHFDYDYSLCQGIPNSINNGGKLTLKHISFSYQSSKKGRLSPYSFNYGSNYNYNIKGYDRWGNFKPQDTQVSGNSGELPASQGISNSEFPYVEQDPTKENQYAQAWSLTSIGLPSGGMIQVDYESDDYAYVQNVRAGQMFKIIGLSGSTTSLAPSDTASSVDNIETRDLPDNSKYFVIRLSTPASSDADFYAKYLDGISNVYFRFLYNMHNSISNSTYDYVPGYATGIQSYGIYPGGKYAYIKFPDVTTNDNGGSTVSPVTKAAIQFGRLNEPKNVWAQPGINVNGNLGYQLLQAILGSSFVANISDAIVGPNEALFTHHGDFKRFYLNKSWIRLNNPNKHKLGGGVRVKRISISDKWNGMTLGAMPSFSYGQEYSYVNDDGSSSGVASYEPQLGGDENSLHTPVFFDVTHLLAPDDKHYMETPFGESFYPSPSVGYGKVTVQNIKYTGVSKHATGKIVHEFWTAKDYPVITDRTDLNPIREKTDPLSLNSFLFLDTKDFMTASQGFYVETNDMHGKPKSQKVYQENISMPISSIEYYYKNTPYQSGSFKLDNTVQTIDQHGATNMQDLGIFFDFVGDFREQSTQSSSTSINANLDNMVIVVDFPIFTIWPSLSNDLTQFRSATVTKVAQRFGILQKTIAKDLGSTVETDNLAYDAETGNVLLTKTKTDYNDPIYILNYPAYWYYDGMGPAYQNIDVSMSGISFASGVANIPSANMYFAPGDELELFGNTKVWVLSVNANGIKVETASGSNPTGTYSVKVVRSGRRNMLMSNMASITSLQNPLTGINGNNYQKVITASGVEYNDQWSIFCDCITSYGGGDPSVSYATGGKGNWHMKRNFAFLTGRTQSNYDNNTNTRKDGVYTSYNPLYKKTGAKWQLDTTNWTFTSKVTMINPNGQELENIDPLGRYSAATYGYNQTFATAVSANARYREIAFDNAEDYDLNNCGDTHFKFTNARIDTGQSHTGRRSIRVSLGSPLSLTKVLNASTCSTSDACDMSSVAVKRVDTNVPIGYTFSGPGAVAPLTISYNITGGNPQITINNTGGINIGNPNSSWSAVVTVTGANGCVKTFILGNGVIQSIGK